MPPRSHGMSRRAWLRTVSAAGIGLTFGTAAYGSVYERHRLGVTRASVPVSGLPESLSGLRIGLLTDPHVSEAVSEADVSHAVELLLQERTDLIVLGGDYVTWGNRGFVEPAAAILQPLTAPHGVYAILGNHDDDRDMPAALRSRGVEVLKDARTAVTVRGERLELVGIRFWTRKVTEIAPLLRGAAGTVILLAHDPRRLAEAAELNVPLMLSGHTHGGQVVLPGIGAIAARNRFPVLEGTTRRENTTLFVSRGVGTVYVPFRLNCPPEVAVLTLERLSEI